MLISRKSRVAIVIAIAVFAALVYLLAWSSALSVKQISIEGAPNTQLEIELLNLSKVTAGQPLARVEPLPIALRIKESDWVEQVHIWRNWLTGKVTITVTPRTPVAIYQQIGASGDATGANQQLIDQSGTVFSLPNYSTAGLAAVSATSPELGLAAIKLFTSLPADFAGQIKDLVAKNETSFTGIYAAQSGDIKITFGKADQIALKIKVFKALLLLPENARVTRVDLSAPHAPIVK